MTKQWKLNINKKLIDELEYKLNRITIEEADFEIMDSPMTFVDSIPYTEILDDLAKIKKEYLNAYLDLVKKHTALLEKE